MLLLLLLGFRGGDWGEICLPWNWFQPDNIYEWTTGSAGGYGGRERQPLVRHLHDSHPSRSFYCRFLPWTISYHHSRLCYLPFGLSFFFFFNSFTHNIINHRNITFLFKTIFHYHTILHSNPSIIFNFN